MSGRADRPIPAAQSIFAFMHCSKCLIQRPDDVSPRDWVRLEAGWTKIGLQIRCSRCDLNICHVDFQGAKHPANVRGSDE